MKTINRENRWFIILSLSENIERESMKETEVKNEIGIEVSGKK